MSKLINSGLLPFTGRGKCGRIEISSITAILLAAFSSQCALSAYADEFHYNNILIGDRAAGMAGAYTAISDDPSGLYYNPAGIAYAQGSNISVSANALHQTKTVYKNALGNGNDYQRNSFALLPNFFGIIQPLGKGKVGFSYAVPDSTIEDQNQTFYNLPGTSISRFALNFNKSDSTYYFGPSYALELTEGLSVGATLYGQYHRNEWIQNQLINTSSGTYEWKNVFYKNTEWGIKPIFGLMWSPTNKLSAGLSISKLNIIQSDTTYQSICAGDASGICDPTYVPGTAPFRVVATSDRKRAYPLTSTIGVAYFHSKTLVVSGDISYNGRVEDSVFGNKEATLNAALGAEYYLDDAWAIKGGVFTDMANTPKIKSGDSDAFDHADFFGGTFSVSYFTRQSSITFGAAYRYGTGQAQITGGQAIQDVTSQASTFFLSAAYFY
jgi:long-chain fatty acid transport protein